MILTNFGDLCAGQFEAMVPFPEDWDGHVCSEVKWDNSGHVGHRRHSCDFCALTAVRAIAIDSYTRPELSHFTLVCTYAMQLHVSAKSAHVSIYLHRLVIIG